MAPRIIHPLRASSPQDGGSPVTRSPRARGLEVRGAGRGLRGPPGCGGAQGRRAREAVGCVGRRAGEAGRAWAAEDRSTCVTAPGHLPRALRGVLGGGQPRWAGSRVLAGAVPQGPLPPQARPGLPAPLPPSVSTQAASPGARWGHRLPSPRSRTARPAQPTVCFQPEFQPEFHPEFQPKLKLFHL